MFLTDLYLFISDVSSLAVNIPGPPGPPGPPGAVGYANLVRYLLLSQAHFTPAFKSFLDPIVWFILTLFILITHITIINNKYNLVWVSWRLSIRLKARCHAVFIQVTIYKTVHAMNRESHRAAEGTLVYVSEKGGELYIRTRNGWRKIQVCIVCVDTRSTTLNSGSKLLTWLCVCVSLSARRVDPKWTFHISGGSGPQQTWRMEQTTQGPQPGSRTLTED